MEPYFLKKIRIDSYQFMVRKGRAYVFLPKRDDNEYIIPSYYVKAEESVAHRIKYENIEDDGDLVINEISLNDHHIGKRDPRWVLLSGISSLQIGRNEQLHITHNMLRFFLSVYRGEEEPGLVRRIEAQLESVRVEIARKKYIAWLQSLLDGKRKASYSLGGAITPADPSLVRHEMETLEHFRIYRPKELPMSLSESDLLEKDEYSFMPVDLAVFGVVEKRRPRYILYEDVEDIPEE